MLHLVFKPHRDTLRAQTSDAQKLFVLLKVIPAAPLASVRPPLALALVLDTSGSMRELSNRAAGGAKSKLDHAIEATRALLLHPRLVPGDLLSVVQFDDVARVLLPLSPLGNGDAARAALDKLKGYSGGTQVAKGLVAARAELGRILQGGVAQRVLLLTDGQAFDPDACREAAAGLAEANVPLVSIGIGDDYNEELLRDLAEIGRGRPYHLSQIEQLDEVFGTEVQASVREVVTGLRAEVQVVNGVSLDSVTRIYPDLAEIDFAPASPENSAQPKAASLSLGNIMAGDYTVFVLELSVSGLERPAGRVRLAQVQLSGVVPTGAGTVDSPRHDIVVSFSGAPNGAEKVDDEVLGYVQQRNVDRLVQGAVRRAATDVPGAQKSLQSAVEMTRRVGNVRVTRLLQESLDELNANGQWSSSTRKTIALETRTRTIKTRAADALSDVPGEDEIRRLTGA
ncbi:MAG TPA: VWA domain-containing protein [Abditibacterium sp.]|jgi:Ca-activated chloride channel family protein